MSRKAQLTVSQDPLGALAQSLPETILAFQRLNQQMDLEKFKTKSAQEYQESIIYLQDMLAAKNINEQQNFELRKEAREFGILQNALNKISETDRTGDREGIVEDRKQQIRSRSEILRADNAMIENELDLYYRGLNVGSSLDIDKSGALSDQEITSYTADLFEDGIVPKSFEQGLKAWTRSPEQQLKIESSLLAIDEQRIRNKFLPKSLQLTQEGLEADVSLKGVNLKTAEFNLEVAEYAGEQARNNIAMQELQIESLQNQINAEEFKFDVEQLNFASEEVDKLLVNNIQAQTGIAAGLLSQITFKNNDGEHIPLFNILTDENVNDVLNDIDDSKFATHIKSDLIGLVEAYHVGKGEEQLPDYTLVLDKFGDIEEINVFFTKWSQANKAGLEETAISEGFESYNNFMSLVHSRDNKAVRIFRDFAGETLDISGMAKINKALDWFLTGMFDYPDQMDSAIQAKEQYRFLNRMQEDIIINKSQFGITGAGNIYNESAADSILAPFSKNIPRRGLIDDIFKMFNK